MNVNEAKEALFNHKKVKFKGIVYEKISALIFRVDEKGAIIQSAELIDKNKRTLVIALVKEIEYDNI